MERVLGILVLFSVSSASFAQETAFSIVPSRSFSFAESPVRSDRSAAELFPNFIGFVSDPVQSIEPERGKSNLDHLRIPFHTNTINRCRSELCSYFFASPSHTTVNSGRAARSLRTPSAVMPGIRFKEICVSFGRSFTFANPASVTLALSISNR